MITGAPPDTLIVVNLTRNQLVYTGFNNGNGVENFSPPINIAPFQWATVATLSGGMGAQWGWSCLSDPQNSNSAYQIYIEVRPVGSTYQSFGYCDPSSTKHNSNPSPFGAWVADCLVSTGIGPVSSTDYYYVLRQTPSAANACVDCTCNNANAPRGPERE